MKIVYNNSKVVIMSAIGSIEGNDVLHYAVARLLIETALKDTTREKELSQERIITFVHPIEKEYSEIYERRD